MLAPPRRPRRTSWNPRRTSWNPRRTLWWNLRGTLPQDRPGSPRSLSRDPKAFSCWGKKKRISSKWKKEGQLFLGLVEVKGEKEGIHRATEKWSPVLIKPQAFISLVSVGRQVPLGKGCRRRASGAYRRGAMHVLAARAGPATVRQLREIEPRHRKGDKCVGSACRMDLP